MMGFQNMSLHDIPEDSWAKSQKMEFQIFGWLGDLSKLFTLHQ